MTRSTRRLKSSNIGQASIDVPFNVGSASTQQVSNERDEDAYILVIR